MDAAQAAGGVLLALGAVVVVLRRSEAGGWTDFELMLTAAVPAVLLFAIAVAGRAPLAPSISAPWRSVPLISAILLAPLALFLFLRWVGASTHHLLYDAAVLVVTAAIAVAGARRAGTPYAIFLAGVALLGAWMLVWLKIISNPSGDTVRWLLLAGGAVLLLSAGTLALLDAAGVHEIATAGGIGLIGAGLVGVIVGLVGVFVAAVGAVSSGGPSSGEGGTVTHPARVHALHFSGSQTVGWDIYVLIVSTAFVWFAARSRARGPGYVGVLGLFIFLVSVGTQLARLVQGHGQSHSLLGWPLILLGLGVVGLLAPVLARRRRQPAPVGGA